MIFQLLVLRPRPNHQLLSINIQFSIKAWDAFLLCPMHIDLIWPNDMFSMHLQFGSSYQKRFVHVGHIWRCVLSNICKYPPEDVNLGIYKSYLISRLKFPISIFILFTTDLPNREREELWRRRRTLHTSRHKVSLHDWDQYQNVDIWFQIDFLECSFHLIQINIKM